MADSEARHELADRAADAGWTWSDARRAISEIGARRTNWAALAPHLRTVIANVKQIDPAILSRAERKLVREARATLGHLV